jgi:3-oxoacyl-[acyl-carrier-protein] synthase-3
MSNVSEIRPVGHHVRITGVGRDVPEDLITNEWLSAIVDTSDEWITTRTGIKERRRIKADEATSDMATRAALRALEMGKVDPATLGLVITATVTPDFMLPATSCLVGSRIGAVNAGAFDVSSACTGFVTSFITGWNMVRGGAVPSALVIGAETLTRITDYKDRATCIIFGDGAGAVVLERVEDESQASHLLASIIGADGSDPSLLNLPAGGSRRPASHETVAHDMHYMKMNGRELFKFAVNIMRDLIPRTCEKAGVAVEDLKLIVPHQVNKRVLDAVSDKMKIPEEKMVINIDRFGNSSAASVPIALSESHEKGLIQRGDLVLLMAFGAGLTWASALVRW